MLLVVSSMLITTKVHDAAHQTGPFEQAELSHLYGLETFGPERYIWTLLQGCQLEANPHNNYMQSRAEFNAPNNPIKHAFVADHFVQAAGSHQVGLASVPVEAAGTPGESGRPRVATPEPACTRKESACPW